MAYSNVLYLALGTERVRAARWHVDRLVEGGVRVTLVVPNHPQWKKLEPPPGVTVRRLGATEPRAALRAARRLLLGRNGPLREVDLLVAGDPQALPVAWAALRRRPELAVRLEPAEEPERRTGLTDLAVVTPWYPSPEDPDSEFVPSALDAVDPSVERISVLHTEEWPYPPQSAAAPHIDVVVERFGPKWSLPVVTGTLRGELTRVAVPNPVQSRAFAEQAEANLRALRAALPTGRIEAPLVHAYGGLAGGLPAVRLARPDARVVVSEQSERLSELLAQPAAKKLYAELLGRAAALLCVNPQLRDLVAAQFPQHAEKLHVLPYPVDPDRFPLRPTPPGNLLRWLHVGELPDERAVRALLAGFARSVGAEPEATLTVVGAGAMAGTVRARARELDIAGRVTLRPAVPAEEYPALLHGHDLLVHLGRHDTFSTVVAAAVVTGLPVFATRSPGAEDVLGGVEPAAGLLVDLTNDPKVVVEGFRELRERLGTLNPAAARTAVLARYGRQAVAAALRRHHGLDSEPLPASAPLAEPVGAGVPAPAGSRSGQLPGPVPGDADRVVVVAISAGNVRRSKAFTHSVVARGMQVDLITADPGAANRVGLGHSVRIHPLAGHEERRPLLRAERLLLRRAPGKILSVARSRTRRMSALRPELTVAVAQWAHNRAAGAFHQKVFNRGYQVVRPLVLWRIARRQAVPKLDLGRTRRVVVSGVDGVTIGWKLARRHPKLPVTTSLAWADDES
ncbi:glycosyltransferase family 4 protein [Plantactinospora sp. BC1]|uniref:glycosyltransferase n=1 Tax=Plantactinospora sp. BC1 TaxID=2108470 RepID=UPI000D17C44F|nr:glycosyltransferase [Plantactinospora sp. BC1]AVT32838.1 glycosyltransferase family 4 protein [Plantactinospora sp. BC1]